MSKNGHTDEWRKAFWYSKLVQRALRLEPNAQLALNAAEMAIEIQPFPDEADIEAPDEDASWREEDDPLGTSDGKPVDVSLSFDIFNIRAQGILNKAMQAAKSLSGLARRDLEKILRKETIQQISAALEEWGAKYRTQLGRLLSTTQLASLMAGMKEVAGHVPTVAPPVGVPDANLPPSLEPEEATALLAKFRNMGENTRERKLYELPVDQQAFVRTALANEAAQPVKPPPIVPPRPPGQPGDPERIHYPIIDEAARILSEKRLVTRDEFDRLDAAARAKAFTVAGVTSEETLGKIRDALSEQIREGVDLKEFRERVAKEVEPGTFMSDGHLENVFRTNVQSAFTDGQMEVLSHPFVRSGFPYAAYEAIHDDRVRPEHKDMENHGIAGSNIFRIDDPVFKRFTPPWDYMCRCSWIPMSVRMAAEKGVAEARSWLASGVEPSPPTFVKPPPFNPPASFQRAPLSIQLSTVPVTEFAEDKPKRKLAAFAGTSATVTAPEPVVSRVGPNSAAQDYAGVHKGKGGKGKTGKRATLRGKARKLRNRAPKGWRGLYADMSLEGVSFAWTPIQGPRGGRGWKNTATGEIRYQSEKPSESASAPQPAPSGPPAAAKPGSTGDSAGKGGSDGEKKAAGVLARYGKAMSDAVNRIPVVGHVKRGMQAAMQKVHDTAANRYGPKTAKAIMASGTVMDLVLMGGGTALTGVPIVTGANQILGIVPAFVLAETVFQFKKLAGAKMGVEESERELSPQEFAGACRDVANQILAEFKAMVANPQPKPDAQLAVTDIQVKSERGIEAVPSKMPDKVGVWNDWDRLRSVIVGIPDHDILPRWIPNWENLDGNEVSLTGDNAGQSKREADPVRFRKCVEQMDRLCELLEKEGVTVYRPPLTPLETGNEDPVGLVASWVREEYTVIGNNIVVNQARAPHRRKELAALEPFFAAIARGDTSVSTPPPYRLLKLLPTSDERNPDWEHDPRPFLEGGDIFRLGRDVIVTMSYLASSPTGYRWLANSLGEEFEVWPAFLGNDWLHGDYCFAPIKEGLCMAHLSAFVDGLLPSPVTDWDVVETTRDEAYDMEGGNVLVIRPGVVISPNPTRRLLRALERKGVDVIDIDFSACTYFQGGCDCATTELLREP